jgi:hypothetical protein
MNFSCMSSLLSLSLSLVLKGVQMIFVVVQVKNRQRTDRASSFL